MFLHVNARDVILSQVLQKLSRITRMGERQFRAAVESLWKSSIILAKSRNVLLVEYFRENVAAASGSLELTPDLPEMLSLGDRLLANSALWGKTKKREAGGGGAACADAVAAVARYPPIGFSVRCTCC